MFPSFGSLHLPPVLPVAEDGDTPHYVARRSLSDLGAAVCPLEVHACGREGEEAHPQGNLITPGPTPRWAQIRGWLQKFYTAIQLSILGASTVALFLISLVGSMIRRGLEGPESNTEPCLYLLQVPYSYVEPGTHGLLWTKAHHLFGTVEHLQLANSYGLFRRMTGLGGRPEVVLEGSYDGHHWTVSLPGAGGRRDPGQPAYLTWGPPGRRLSSCTNLET